MIKWQAWNFVFYSDFDRGITRGEHSKKWISEKSV